MELEFNYQILCNIIREIAAEDHIYYRDAIEQIFQWVEKQYSGIKLRQKIQVQNHLEHAKSNNRPTSYHFHSEVHSIDPSVQRSRLEEQELERERQMRSRS